MSESGFTVSVYQNEYLPEGGQEVNAIVTVTSPADGPPGGAVAADAAEVIIIDCSGSMGAPRTKIEHARLATSAAIDVIRDGVSFAVIAGTATATAVYPARGGMAVAGPATRAEARQAVARLRPDGGTAIGTWLDLARALFERTPAGIRHAILLTDGKNEHQHPADLDAAIEACDQVFSCDCRGVGTDWVVAELRKVASGLLGSVDIVPEPEGLSADFAAMMENAMGKQLPDVQLRLWMPQDAQLTFIRQVSPALEDLTGRGTQSGPQSGDYPTGAWGAGESRDYHLCIKVGAAEVGQEMLAARVSLLTDGQVAGQGLVRAIGTSDVALSTQINPAVAHYTGQGELAASIQEGLQARRDGDEAAASQKLGRAVQLAHESGNTQAAQLLAKVVDVIDAASGTVQVRKKVSALDEMTLDTRSTITVKRKK